MQYLLALDPAKLIFPITVIKSGIKKKSISKPPDMFKKLLQVKASSNYTKKARQKQLLQHSKIILIGTWEHNTLLSNLYMSWGPENTHQKPPSNPRCNQQHKGFWKPVPSAWWWESVWRNTYPCTSMCRHAHMSIQRKLNYTAPTQKKPKPKQKPTNPQPSKKPKPPRKSMIEGIHREKAPNQPGIKTKIFCFQE